MRMVAKEGDRARDERSSVVVCVRRVRSSVMAQQVYAKK